MRIERRSWDGSDAEPLAAELRAFAPAPAAIAADVAALVESVRAGGDRRVIELGEQLDGVRVDRLRVDPEAVSEALATLDPELRTALGAAAENISAVASAQVSGAPTRSELRQGHAVEIVETPVRSAAIYVPGGRAPYPSTALMGALAARAAGVDRVAVASPPAADGLPDRTVLAACAIAEVDEVYAIGGAQAVAALALGTESVERVDMVAGPGGPWVQEAKLAVARECGIDGYAGPSELVVVSDGSTPPAWLALDVCAQAEHGSDGLLVLVGTDPSSLDAFEDSLGDCADPESVADAPVVVIDAPGLDDALALAEAIAPEHLQLSCAGAQALARRVRTAGCVFVGPEGGTAFGDYAAGSNHVLPTGGAGRFTGPLGPGSFRRKLSIVEMSPAAAVELGGVVDTIARAEGFPIHGASALARGSGDEQSAKRADKEIRGG